MDDEESNVESEKVDDVAGHAEDEDTSSEDGSLVDEVEDGGEVSYNKVVAVIVADGMSVDELLVGDGLNELGSEEETKDGLGDSGDSVNSVVDISGVRVSVLVVEAWSFISSIVDFSDLDHGEEGNSLEEHRDKGHEEEVELAISVLDLRNVEGTVDFLDG